MRTYLRELRALRRDIKLFLLYNLLATVGFGVFQLIFNLYLVELDLREDYIGAFNAVQTLAMAATGATLGPVLNRFGVWRSIVGGVGLLQVASLALAFTEGRLLLLVLAAFYGVGLAYLFNPTMPFILEWARRDQRQLVATVSFSLISLATTIGSLVGGFVPALLAALFGTVDAESVTAYRWTLVVGTAVATAGLVPLFVMREARTGKGRGPTAAELALEDPVHRSQVRRDMGMFILVGGIMSLGVGMVIPFYNVFLKSLGASATEVGYVYALGGLTAAVIGLGAPYVARKLGSLRAVLVLRCSIIPFYFLLVLMPGYWLAVLAHLVRQTSISMAWPIDSTFIGEVLPPRARSSVFGLRSGAWNLGFAGASLLGGAIIVRSGYDWTFVSINVFTALSAVLFVGYFGRHPRVRSGEIASALPPRRPVPGRVAPEGDEPQPRTAA